MNRPTTEELVKELSTFANNFTPDTEGFVDGVCSLHRTLQQGLFGLFAACLKRWAENFDTGNYDLRNEYACKTSKRIIEALGEDAGYLERPPCI